MHPCKLTPTANVIGWGGRCFKPRFLSLFFWSDRKLGLERWLPPRAFVLGVFLSALFLSFLLPVFLVFAYRVFYNKICLSFFLRPVVGAVRFLSSLFVCRVLLPLAVAHVVGGFFFCVGGHVCCGVCVFSPASPCFKESPRGAPLCRHCLLLLLFVPSPCFLSTCLLLSCLFLC